MNNVPYFDMNKLIRLALGKNRKATTYWAAVYLNNCGMIIIINEFTSSLRRNKKAKVKKKIISSQKAFRKACTDLFCQILKKLNGSLQHWLALNYQSPDTNRCSSYFFWEMKVMRKKGLFRWLVLWLSKLFFPLLFYSLDIHRYQNLGIKSKSQKVN